MNGFTLIYLVIVCFLEDAYIEDALVKKPLKYSTYGLKFTNCDEKSIWSRFCKHYSLWSLIVKLEFVTQCITRKVSAC